MLQAETFSIDFSVERLFMSKQMLLMSVAKKKSFQYFPSGLLFGDGGEETGVVSIIS